jgi:hypothetical protein
MSSALIALLSSQRKFTQDTADIEDEDEDEPELDAGGYVLIPNSIKVALPIPSNEFLSEVSHFFSGVVGLPHSLLKDSPFREDAEKRTRYLNYTAIHPSMYHISVYSFHLLISGSSEDKGARSISRSCSHREPSQTRIRGSKRVQ